MCLIITLQPLTATSLASLQHEKHIQPFLSQIQRKNKEIEIQKMKKVTNPRQQRQDPFPLCKSTRSVTTNTD